MLLFPDQTTKSLLCLGRQVKERTGIGTTVFLVSGIDQHLDTLGELEFQSLVEEEEILMRVLSLDRLNLIQVEMSKRQSTCKVNGNHTPPFNWFKYP